MTTAQHTKIRPVGSRVLVRRSEAQKSKGGIILPDSAKEKPVRGEVLAVGPGSTNKEGHIIPMTVKKGDVVYFSAYSGTELSADGEDLLILREDDILGIATH